MYYFTLASNFCSILSFLIVIAVAIYAYFQMRGAKNYKGLPVILADKILNSLITRIQNDTTLICSTDTPHIPGLNYNKVRLCDSFLIIVNSNAAFNLFKIGNSYYIYGCLDLIKPSYRLIANSKKSQKVKELHTLCAKGSIPDTDIAFVEEMLHKI